jgi:hypothetical protein
VNRDRQLGLAVGLDVFAIVVFVGIGRRTHDEGSVFIEIVETAAPFLIGLATGWGLVRAWRRPTKVFIGIAIWPIVVLVGMVLRNIVFDRGAATSFVVVATLFVGATLVGWRLIYRAIVRRTNSNRVIAVGGTARA